MCWVHFANVLIWLGSIHILKTSKLIQLPTGYSKINVHDCFRHGRPTRTTNKQHLDVEHSRWTSDTWTNVQAAMWSTLALTCLNSICLSSGIFSMFLQWGWCASSHFQCNELRELLIGRNVHFVQKREILHLLRRTVFGHYVQHHHAT